MDKWDKRFLNLAEHIAQWSKDDSTKVGAVIVKNKNNIVSVGYNGFPQYIEDKWDSREEKYAKTIHAEENAILFADKNIDWCHIYVTHPPCSRCAAKIIQSGIFFVTVNKPSTDYLSRWQQDYDYMKQMFKEAHITYKEF